MATAVNAEFNFNNTELLSHRYFLVAASPYQLWQQNFEVSVDIIIGNSWLLLSKRQSFWQRDQFFFQI